MDPRTFAAWSLMRRIEQCDGAFHAGGPYDQHGLLTFPRYRDISGCASPGMPRVCAPHFESVLGQRLPHRGAWVHLSRTFLPEPPGSPAVLGFVFWDDAGDRWVRFAALPWDASDRVCPDGSGIAAETPTLPDAAGRGEAGSIAHTPDHRVVGSASASSGGGEPGVGSGRELDSPVVESLLSPAAAATFSAPPPQWAAAAAGSPQAPPGLYLRPAPVEASTRRAARLGSSQDEASLAPTMAARSHNNAQRA